MTALIPTIAKSANDEKTRAQEECPFVSIVIPEREKIIRNNPEIIRQCLKSLDKLNYPKDKYEIIISVNSSQNENQATVKKNGALYVFTTKKTISASRNQGFKIARGEIIAFSDVDCEMDKNWIKNSLKYFKDPTVAGVGGINITPQNETPFGKAVGFVLNQAIFSAGSVYGRILKKIKEVKSIAGCNAIFRKTALARVMPVQETSMTGEDYLMNQKIRQLGYKLLYTPDTVVWHHRRPIPKKFFKQIYFYAIGRLFIGKKDPKMINLIHIIAGLGIPLVATISVILILLNINWFLVFLSLGVLFLAGYFFLAWLKLKSLKAALCVPPAIVILFLGWSTGFLKELFFRVTKKQAKQT